MTINNILPGTFDTVPTGYDFRQAEGNKALVSSMQKQSGDCIKKQR